MSSDKVLISRSILDNLADTISEKTEKPSPMTLDQMTNAVNDLSSGGIIIIDTENNKNGITREILAENVIKLESVRDVVLDSTPFYIKPSEGYDAIENVVIKDSIFSLPEVAFWDYEGTLLYSYTASEFLSLSNFPSGPSHEGLTFVGWNWMIEQAQDYVEQYGYLDIGAMYDTDDQSFRFYISLTDKNFLSPEIKNFYNNTVRGSSVDWGDGTIDILEDTGQITLNHTYSSIGNYCIKFKKLPNYTGNFLFPQNRDGFFSDIKYDLAVTKIELTKGGGFSQNPFAFLYNVQSITMPPLSDPTLEHYWTTITPNMSGLRKCKHITIPYYTSSNTLPSAGELRTISVSPYSQRPIDQFAQNVTKASRLKRHCLPFNGTAIWANQMQDLPDCETVIFPQGFTKILVNAFANTGITQAIFPSSLKEIGASVFTNCKKLKKVVFKNNLLAGAGSSFCENDSSLEEVVFPDDFSILGSRMFQNCTNLKYINIPTTSELTEIPSNFMNSCKKIKQLTIPANIITIKNDAFAYLSSLEKLTFEGNNLITIQRNCFRESFVLREVTFPASLTTLGAYAFNYCPNILKYHFQSETPPSLGDANVFAKLNANCVMYVPYSSDHHILEAYQTETNWVRLASYIQEEPQ